MICVLPSCDAHSLAFQGAPLRLSTIPKSYGDHFLIIGDAAGFIDPLTGEGIQVRLYSLSVYSMAVLLPQNSFCSFIRAQSCAVRNGERQDRGGHFDRRAEDR
jgi:hypothetical protein